MLSGLMRKHLRRIVLGGDFRRAGPGTVRLAPSVPGEVRVIDMANECWLVGDGFLACDDEITLQTSRQKLSACWAAPVACLF